MPCYDDECDPFGQDSHEQTQRDVLRARASVELDSMRKERDGLRALGFTFTEASDLAVLRTLRRELEAAKPCFVLELPVEDVRINGKPARVKLRHTAKKKTSRKGNRR